MISVSRFWGTYEHIFLRLKSPSYLINNERDIYAPFWTAGYNRRDMPADM